MHHLADFLEAHRQTQIRTPCHDTSELLRFDKRIGRITEKLRQAYPLKIAVVSPFRDLSVRQCPEDLQAETSAAVY